MQAARPLPAWAKRGPLLTALAAGGISMAAVAIALAATGGGVGGFYDWRWPAALPVLLGAGWGLHAARGAAWPDRLLMVCGGVAGCVTLAHVAGGLAAGLGVGTALEVAVSTLIEIFTYPLDVFEAVGLLGAPVSLLLYVAACWGFAASALWKGWGALRARRVALALLLAAGLGWPADAPRAATFEEDRNEIFWQARPHYIAGRYEATRVVLLPFMRASPDYYGFDTRELNRVPSPSVGGASQEAAVAHYLWARFRAAEPQNARLVATLPEETASLYGHPLLTCMIALGMAQDGMARDQARRATQNRADCLTARERFPANPVMVELFGAAAAPRPPSAATVQAPAASPAPVPAPRAAPAPVQAAPGPATRRQAALASWRTFDMLAIGAAALLGLGWLALRRKRGQGA